MINVLEEALDSTNFEQFIQDSLDSTWFQQFHNCKASRYDWRPWEWFSQHKEVQDFGL